MTTSTCAVCGAVASEVGVVDASTGLRLASWWHRVGATFSDNLILLIPTYLAFILVGSVLGVLAGFIASTGVQGLYLVKLLASPRGQTIGNRIVGTRVRDEKTGQAINSQQAFKRWGFVALYQMVIVLLFGRYALYSLGVVSLIDYLYPLFDEHKRTIHDRFAGTIVVMA